MNKENEVNMLKENIMLELDGILPGVESSTHAIVQFIEQLIELKIHIAEYGDDE